MSSKFFRAATIMVAVFFCLQPVFGQDFFIASKHNGKIEKVLVTFSRDSIVEALLAGEDITFSLVRNLLCTFHDYNISSCLVSQKQIQVCKPFEERASFMIPLRKYLELSFDSKKGPGKWCKQIEKLESLDLEIQRLEKELIKKSLFQNDLGSRFWESSSTKGLKKKQIQLLEKTRKWYDNYLLFLEEVFATNWMPVFEKDSTEFCASNSFGAFSLVKNCESMTYNAATILGQTWSQDEYLVFTDSSQHKVVPRLNSEGRKGDLLSRLVNGPCSIQVDTSIALDIQGGNMLVSGPFALIGKDVLKESYSAYDGIDAAEKTKVENRLKRIDLDTNATDSMITQKLSSILGKKIVWIGSEKPSWSYFDRQSSNFSDWGYGYQPVWHIDLFLHPISFVESNGQPTMKLLVGMPDEKWQLEHEMSEVQKRTRKSLINGVKDKINESVGKLKDDLLKHGVALDTVHTPLAFGFRRAQQNEKLYESIDEYFSSCNGLVHQTDSGSVFFSPKWPPSTLTGLFASAKFNSVIEEKLSRAGLTYVAIEGDYGQGGALHCKVLVTKRSE